MLKSILMTLFYFSLLTCLHAQTVSLSVNLVDYETVIAGSTDTQTIHIINQANQPVEITGVRSFLPVLSSPLSTPATINPDDSLEIELLMTPETNIDYNGFVAIETQPADSVFIVRVTGHSVYSDSWYQSTQNLWAEALKTALFDLIKNHTDLGYSGARDVMFAAIDNYNGTIESVYTGQVITASNRTEAQNQGFNTEHTWPQGSFDSALPMRSDLFHIFPCDANSNSQRGSFPFGVVVNTTWTQGGSKLGTDSNGEIVFEPRDVHKGNAARALLYFLIHYQNAYDFYNYDGVWYPMTQTQENILRDWHFVDLPDTIEINRNEQIFSYQHNRNPFIDHPDFVDRISSFVSTASTPQNISLDASPLQIDFNNIAVGDTGSYFLTLLNTGNASMNITSATVSQSEFNAGNYLATMAAKSKQKIQITFVPLQLNHVYNADLTIQSNAGEIIIPLSGQGIVSSITDEDHSAMDFRLFANYPNPFNPVTTISWSLPHTLPVTLTLFDMNGRVVDVPVKQIQRAGMHSIKWNGNGRASGIYIMQLRAGTFSASKKTLLLR